eukprot:scaffold1525_cov254-Pinguiococcus_pyrenoidosus.AAC.6
MTDLFYTLVHGVPRDAEAPELRTEDLAPGWTERFHKGLSMPQGSLEQKRARLASLSATYEDFVSLATRYTVTLVDEFFLNAELKTLQFRRLDNSGGEGEKYLYGGIVLTLATASQPFDGDYAAASKAIGQELKGANHYARCAPPEVSTALYAVIDYRGYRVLATSEIPIRVGSSTQPGTLKVGRAKAMNQVFSKAEGAQDDDTAAVYEAMAAASAELNMAPHTVTCEASQRNVLVPAAADIEGHVGLDDEQRIYLQCFARAFPPESLKYAAHLDNLDLARIQSYKDFRKGDPVKYSFADAEGNVRSRYGIFLAGDDDDATSSERSPSVEMNSDRLSIDVRADRQTPCIVLFPGRGGQPTEKLKLDCLSLDRCRADPILYRRMRPEFLRSRGLAVSGRNFNVMPESTKVKENVDPKSKPAGPPRVSRAGLVEALVKAPPLSADAFAPCTMQVPDSQAREEDVNVASRILFELVVPELAEACITEHMTNQKKRENSLAMPDGLGAAAADALRSLIDRSNTVASQPQTEDPYAGVPRLRRLSMESLTLLRASKALRDENSGSSSPSPAAATKPKVKPRRIVPADEKGGYVEEGGGERLCKQMHDQGVNIRHMGLLRARCVFASNDYRKDPDPARAQAVASLARLMLLEMVCRELKNALKDLQRTWLEAFQRISENEVHALLARFLNHVTGATSVPECTAFWEDLSDRIGEHFGECALDPHERGYELFRICVTPSMRASSDAGAGASAGRPEMADDPRITLAAPTSHVRLILTRLLDMSGIALTPEAARQLETARFGGAGFEFVSADILEVFPVVKRMHKARVLEAELLHVEALHREAQKRAQDRAHVSRNRVFGRRDADVRFRLNEDPAKKKREEDTSANRPPAAAIEIRMKFRNAYGYIADRVNQHRLDERASLAAAKAARQIPHDMNTRHIMADSLQSRTYFLRLTGTREADEERVRLTRQLTTLRRSDINTRCYLSKVSYKDDILGVVVAVKCLLSPKLIGKRFPRMQVCTHPVSLSAYLTGVKYGFFPKNRSAPQSEVKWLGDAYVKRDVGPPTFPAMSLLDYVGQQRLLQEKGRPPEYLTLHFLPIAIDKEHVERSRNLVRFSTDAIVSMRTEPFVDLESFTDTPARCPYGGEALESTEIRRRYMPLPEESAKDQTLLANASQEDVDVHTMELVSQLMNNVVVELAKLQFLAGSAPLSETSINNTMQMYCRLHHFLICHVKTSEFMTSRIRKHVELFREDRNVRKNGRNMKSGRRGGRPGSKKRQGPYLNQAKDQPHCTPDLGAFLVYVLLSNSPWDEAMNEKLRDGVLRESMLRRCYWQVSTRNRSTRSSAPTLLFLEAPREQLEEDLPDWKNIAEIKEGMQSILANANVQLARLRSAVLFVGDHQSLAFSRFSRGASSVDKLIRQGYDAIQAVHDCLAAVDITEYELLRLSTSFAASDTSHKTLMLQVIFMRAMWADDDGKVLSMYQRNSGKPTPLMAHLVREGLETMRSVEDYSQFFEFLSLWYGPKLYCRVLRDSLRWAIGDNHHGMISEMHLDRIIQLMDCSLEKELPFFGDGGIPELRSVFAQRAQDWSRTEEFAKTHVSEIEHLEWQLVAIAAKLVKTLEQAVSAVRSEAPKSHAGRKEFEMRVLEVSKKQEIGRIVSDAEKQVKEEIDEKKRAKAAAAEEAKAKAQDAAQRAATPQPPADDAFGGGDVPNGTNATAA